MQNVYITASSKPSDSDYLVCIETKDKEYFMSISEKNTDIIRKWVQEKSNDLVIKTNVENKTLSKEEKVDITITKLSKMRKAMEPFLYIMSGRTLLHPVVEGKLLKLLLFLLLSDKVANYMSLYNPNYITTFILLLYSAIVGYSILIRIASWLRDYKIHSGVTYAFTEKNTSYQSFYILIPLITSLWFMK